MVKPPRNNLSSPELRALRELKTDETIVILSADKGSATVVMNTSFYQRKIEENLNPYTYKKTEKRSYGSGPKKDRFSDQTTFRGA